MNVAYLNETPLVIVPGGADKQMRPLILINIPQDNRNDINLIPQLQYLLLIFSKHTKQIGFTILIDGRKDSWKLSKLCIKQINDTLEASIPRQLIVVKPDGFWDMQKMENCTSSNKETEVIFITKSRLNKFVNQSHLPIELGGSFVYDHTKWILNRQKIDEFYKDANVTLKELDDLYHYVTTNKPLNNNLVEEDVNVCFEMIEAIKMLVYNVIETGKELVQSIEDENRTRKLSIDNIDTIYTPQDTLDTIERIHKTTNDIRQLQHHVEVAWFEMETFLINNKDFNLLKHGIVRVINWILGPAEQILNENQKVGYDVTSAEELRREHESIEFECWQTYGTYAELLYKINSFNLNPTIMKNGNNEVVAVHRKDLISQKEFMDFICKSFALRLERRRNVLITSLRFFRLVSDYFDRTDKVFDSLIMKHDTNNFKQAAEKLKKLQDSQAYLESIEMEIRKEGEKLSDILSMPVKNSLGQEIKIDYSEDIANIRDILDATIARKNIFNDNVDSQKLILQQITLVESYEKDVEQAITWLEDILKVMMREHAHIGCTIHEIQSQKKEHQVYQDIANDAYNYGCQLLNASFLLKQSCKLSLENHNDMCYLLKYYWRKIIAVSQEQLARLRVSTVFYRSVENYSNQLRNMREAVAILPSMNLDDKKARLKEYFAERENLMVEVGRIVRLGRLLRTRLKEPICDIISSSDQPSVSIPPQSNSIDETEFQALCETAIRNNEIIIESITEQLFEVTQLAEELDQVLKSVRQDCIIFSTESKLNLDVNNNYSNEMDECFNQTDESNKKSSSDQQQHRSDEEFLTASDSTLQHSRSSSYNTASECEQQFSTWWQYDNDNLRQEVNTENDQLALTIRHPFRKQLPHNADNEVLKTSTEISIAGKAMNNTTDNSHIRIHQQHLFGIKSFVLISETVSNTEAQKQIRIEEIDTNNSDANLINKANNVGDQQQQDVNKPVWSNNYSGLRNVTRQTIKKFMLS